MSNFVNNWFGKNPQYNLTLIIILLMSPSLIFLGYHEIIRLDTSLSSQLITAALALLYTCLIWRVSKQYKIAPSNTAKDDIQTEALNDHSMVTRTDFNSDITYVNEKFLAITGYESSDLIGESSSFYWPDHEEALLHEIRTTLKNGQKWSGNVPLKAKDGTIIHTHSTYVPEMDKYMGLIGSIAVRTDITKNKVATGDKSTRRSLHILRDEIYMFEAGTLLYTYLNQAAMDRCGWDENIYTQKTIFERDIEFDSDGVYDIKSFYERARPLINGEAEEVTHEMSIDGTPSEVKMQLVRPDIGQPYFMTIVRDISERHAFDKTKDNFISTVSHELRTPVTSIKGALGLILSGNIGETNEKVQKMLDIAYRNSDRLSLIINDILDLEKIAAGRMKFHLESVDMAELIKEAITENRPYSERYEVTMVSKGMKEGVFSYCDRDRIFQVMNNLLSNAAKFSKKGGEVTITLKEKTDSVYISVEDTGTGIPNEAKATIFDRFTQADSSDRREKGGTGLGLSIVKTLINKQNGTIDFVSKLGEGTTFFFELPKAQNNTHKIEDKTEQLAAE